MEQQQKTVLGGDPKTEPLEETAGGIEVFHIDRDALSCPVSLVQDFPENMRSDAGIAERRRDRDVQNMDIIRLPRPVDSACRRFPGKNDFMKPLRVSLPITGRLSVKLHAHKRQFLLGWSTEPGLVPQPSCRHTVRERKGASESPAGRLVISPRFIGQQYV